MPTARTRGQHLRPISDTLTDDERNYLLFGHDFFSQGFADEPERMKALWKANREELLTLTELGKRPWAWYQWEAPEPRRILQGPGNVIPPDIPKALFESEAAYLYRLGLLSAEEKVKLTMRDFNSTELLPVQYPVQYKVERETR